MRQIGKMGQTMCVGLVGCGNISNIYLKNAQRFNSYEIVACADILDPTARTRADAYGITAMSVDNLMMDPTIDIILNLTIPDAHAAVSLRAIEVGKHVYSEKPLAANFMPCYF